MVTSHPTSPKVLRALSRRIFFVSHHVPLFYGLSIFTAAVLLALVLGIGMMFVQKDALSQTLRHQVALTLPASAIAKEGDILKALKTDQRVASVVLSDVRGFLPPPEKGDFIQNPRILLVTLQEKSSPDRAWVHWREKWPFLLRLSPDVEQIEQKYNQRLRSMASGLGAALVLLSLAHFFMARSMRGSLKPITDVFALFDPRQKVWRHLWSMLPRIPLILSCTVVLLGGTVVALFFVGAEIFYRLPLLLLCWGVLVALVCLLPWQASGIVGRLK